MTPTEAAPASDQGTTRAASRPDPRAAWSDPAPERPLPFWASVRDDLVAHIPPERHAASRRRWLAMGARVVLGSAGFHVTFVYRVNHLLVHRAGVPGRLVARIVNWLVLRYCLCSISPRARLHGGLILPHPQSIIIGEGVVVGPRAWIFQGVTMGGSAGKTGEPRVGADARIHVGAVLAGPIVLGDQVVVCPNTLVQRNVPDRSTVVGVPGNVFPQFNKP